MNDRKERLFFALSLDQTPAAKQAFHRLCQVAKALPGKGRPVPTANLHLTLAFLGMVTNEQKQQLIDLTDNIAIPPFSLRCSHLHYKKRNQLIWLGSDNVPLALEQLAARLKQAAEQVGLEQEARRFTPHITLKKRLRHLDEELPGQADFTFHFQHFGLYISEPADTEYGAGVRYRCLHKWPLTKKTSTTRTRNEI